MSSAWAEEDFARKLKGPKLRRRPYPWACACGPLAVRMVGREAAYGEAAMHHVVRLDLGLARVACEARPVEEGAHIAGGPAAAQAEFGDDDLLFVLLEDSQTESQPEEGDRGW